MVYFFSEDIEPPKIGKGKIRNWIKEVIESYDKKAGEICIIFCSDSYLLEMNQKYLNHNYFTDIITFNYNDDNILSGDIFISIDTVKKNAKSFNVNFLQEIHRVIIHGILHLVGFDDANDKQKMQMRKKENEALSKLNNG
ncbi:MAG: rRNA maturation RNase YbeY [Prolixibacteraceae bacterium]|nr:rRNA maturation RNase YbeY [Prolixibacteraceae bacterium]